MRHAINREWKGEILTTILKPAQASLEFANWPGMKYKKKKLPQRRNETENKFSMALLSNQNQLKSFIMKKLATKVENNVPKFNWQSWVIS